MAKASTILGVGLGLGVLALAGFVWGASREMLRAIPSAKRKDVLRAMARMRAVGPGTTPGSFPDRSFNVEYRPTTPSDWSESILSWIEARNMEGYSIAYWEAEDPTKTTVVAFRPEEEKALAGLRYQGTDHPGWVTLLDPKQFTKVMAGESRDELLRGVPALRAVTETILRGPLPTIPTAETYQSGPTGSWTFDPLLEHIKVDPEKGERFQARLSATKGGSAIVEGAFEGWASGRGQLKVDRIVEVIEKPEPEKGTYEMYDEKKIAAQTLLQRPQWGVLDPTAVAARTYDPPLASRPPAGSRVLVAIRETNPLGRAVLVVDGTVLPAEPGDAPTSVRVSAGDPVRIIRSGKDAAYPPSFVVDAAALVDPASLTT